jgi:hypothetical protein
MVAAVLLMLAAFCVFGFLASFEPTDNALVFRIGYAIIGIGSLAGAGVLVRSASHRDT